MLFSLWFKSLEDFVDWDIVYGLFSNMIMKAE